MNLPCAASWAGPIAMIAFALLIAVLIGFALLPLRRPVRVDPHSDPYGDQPNPPRADGGSSKVRG
jgi:hypothetical protein